LAAFASLLPLIEAHCVFMITTRAV